MREKMWRMSKQCKEESRDLEKAKFGRRLFLRVAIGGTVVIPFWLGLKAILLRRRYDKISYQRESNDNVPVYLFRGASPEVNIQRFVRRLGGIDSIVGKDDIVIIKPNAQWWRQGMTNTDSIVALIEMILDSPNFSGEVIIADNHQAQVDNAAGWTTDEPNGRLNLNGVVDWFNQKGYKNVTKYHWHCAGANPNPLQGNASGNAVVSGPGKSDGYVWERDNFYVAANKHKCLMTYPIFTSAYSGVTIDFKHGAWRDGAYTGQPIRFINMSSLNYHGTYAGATASVKNLMGVVDMSCGFPAPEPRNTYNTHHIGIKSQFLGRVHRQMLRSVRIHREAYKAVDVLLAAEEYMDFHFTGGVLGRWISTVRKPDLNIITADWVGNGGRLDLDNASRPRALVASTDAVAADYVAAKYVLLPETRKHLPGSINCKLVDPDNRDGPFHKFLLYAASETDGAMDDAHIDLLG